MILIADGGSTKVDWRLIDKREQKAQLYTSGANPFFRTEDEIARELDESLLPWVNEAEIDAVYFYGAGCVGGEKNRVLEEALRKVFPTVTVEIQSDLLAAARGLCGRSEGIACILGTGSNSCYYDGSEIVQNVSPLGYILGDEGSGAVLGRLFIGACFKNQLEEGIKDAFLNRMECTQSSILDKVYRQPLPNRFLASLAPFIKENISNPSVYDLVENAFKEFFIRNLMQYPYTDVQIFFTGSIAYYFQDVLLAAAQKVSVDICSITVSPMDGLIEFHSA